MDRVVVIPAAGSGSRLGGRVPKLLVPVNGRPMVEHLLELYAPHAGRMVVIVSPEVFDRVSAMVRGRTPPVSIAVQDQPTGMLDAVLLARGHLGVVGLRRVLITWCDQIAILPETVAAVVAAAAERPEPSLVLPTCLGDAPYVHLRRDVAGRIVDVLHRREGDEMPGTGESDAGVFDLSLTTYRDWLPEYAANPAIGARTGERNFVPFVAWVARRGTVVTVPCREAQEAIGINTPLELATLEAHLRARGRR